MVEIDDGNYTQQVENNDGLVVLDFGAAWCQPCKKLEPILEELESQYAGRAVIAHCDVAKAPGLARRFGIMSVPTVVFMKGGEKVDHFIGLQSREKIVEMIDKHV
jgi:thioredoxin 1